MGYRVCIVYDFLGVMALKGEAEVRARLKELDKLRQMSVEHGKCKVCGYIPKLKHGCNYRGWRLAVRKQAMGAHFKKHDKELLGGGGGRAEHGCSSL